MSKPPDSEQLKAILAAVQAVADAIRDLKQVPKGQLYAALMGQMSLDQFNRIIGILTRGGLVTDSGNVLKWVEGLKVSA